MNREEEIKRFAHNYSEENYKGDSYEAYAEKEDIAKACVDSIKWADQNPREGLWDAEKVITWVALHAELYGGFNQGKLNSMCEDLRKTMEDRTMKMTCLKRKMIMEKNNENQYRLNKRFNEGEKVYHVWYNP